MKTFAKKWPAFFRYGLAWLAAIVVLISLPAIYHCVIAVNNGEPPTGFNAYVVVGGAVGIYTFAGAIAGILAYGAFAHDD